MKNENKKQIKMYTDYATAVKWCNNNMVLLNNICEIDQSFFEDNSEIFAEDEEGNLPEYYQYFITDCSQSDVEYLQKTFDGLVFGFSELLDAYILCVGHFGTAWRGVPVAVKSAEWWRINGEQYGYKENF